MTQVYKLPSTPKEASCCSGPIDDLLQPEFFKALTDSTRLKIFSCLARCARPCSVSEIAECCAVDLSVVSRHLKILESGGLIGSRKESRTVWYNVRYKELIQSLRELADAFEGCCSAKSSKNKTAACC